MYEEITNKIKEWLSGCKTNKEIDELKNLVNEILFDECENKKHEGEYDLD